VHVYLIMWPYIRMVLAEWTPLIRSLEWRYKNLHFHYNRGKVRLSAMQFMESAIRLLFGMESRKDSRDREGQT